MMKLKRLSSIHTEANGAVIGKSLVMCAEQSEENYLYLSHRGKIGHTVQKYITIMLTSIFYPSL